MALSKTRPPRDEPVISAPPSYSEATTTTTTARNTPPATPLTPASEISPSSSVHGSPRASIHSPDTTAYSAQPPAAWTGPEPPPGAQRARAPLRIEKSNHGIQDDFLVTTDGSKDASTPDAWLQTTNSPIDCGVWVDDCPWKRPVEVFVKTANSKIQFALHTLAAHQVVNIKAITTNSYNTVLLPSDFHGLVMLGTTNSRLSLSPALQARSVQVPNGSEETNTSAEWYEINGPNGESRADIRSTNGKVRAGFVSDAEMATEKGEKSCCVM